MMSLSNLQLPPSIIITLHRGLSIPATYVGSPFVTKLEARLRFSRLSYRVAAGSMARSPRGKIPYVSVMGLPAASAAGGAVVLSDTSLICERFVREGLMRDLNEELPPADRARDLALRGMLEERLFFFQVYERWHENYYTMRGSALAALSYPLQILVGLLAYRNVQRTLYGQGTGRFNATEIHRFRVEIWESINALLVESRGEKRRQDDEGKPFWVLGGREPSEADATLFGFIGAGLVCKAAPETEGIIRASEAVMDYAGRIHDCYFPDYEKWDEESNEPGP